MGKRPFEGETVSHVLAAVLAKDPDLLAIPERMRPLLAHGLEKDPKVPLVQLFSTRLLRAHVGG